MDNEELIAYRTLKYFFTIFEMNMARHYIMISEILINTKSNNHN